MHPTYAVDTARTVESYDCPWELWVATLSRARKGDVSWVPNLLDVYQKSQDPVLDRQCAYLIGDAAPGSMVAQIRDLIAASLIPGDAYDPQFSTDMAYVLFSGMRLGDIPLMLDIYQDGIGYEGTEIIEVYMSRLLGDVYLDGEASSLESDSNTVRKRYAQLISEYDTGDLLIWNGRPFSVPDFSRSAVADIQSISTPITWRHTFESATGIDCRAFFEGGVFQPLAAVVTVEEFLNGPELARFKPGVRYFFGHPIPE